MPIAWRKKPGNTSDNLAALLDAIDDPACAEVRFFSTDTKPSGAFGQSDGPEVNLPLVCALACYKVAREHSAYVVFDGLFLTAARLPRYSEVRQLLDAAENSGKVVFYSGVVPFTSSLSAQEAASVLSNQLPTIPLNASTRAAYFSQLSNVTEVQLQKL